MGLAAFNRMRRLKAQQAAEETAKLEEQEQIPVPVELENMSYLELRALAKERGIESYYNMNTEELREALKEGE